MKQNSAELKQIVRKLFRAKILVVGDVMLDHFIWGKVNRISPEAPVPVVEVCSESSMPGGAANVSLNLSRLGVETCMLGIIGKDENGDKLVSLLQENNISTDGLIPLEDIVTTRKSRVIAHQQQVVRVDRDSRAISAEDEKIIISRISEIAENFDAIIIEDYGKGVITQPVVDSILEIASKNKIFTSFDPKIGHDININGLGLSTPNISEANYMAKVFSEAKLSLPAEGEKLRHDLGLDNLLITLGEEGMALFSGDEPFVIPTTAKEVFDVSGAGDTVISVLTAAYVSGATIRQAALLANIAAGIVIGKLGTATVSVEEIISHLDN